jgi:Protein O-mannosyl-transferase TMEM260-like
VSSRRTKPKRRQGHPARAAQRSGVGTTPTKKGRPVPGARPKRSPRRAAARAWLRAAQDRLRLALLAILTAGRDRAQSGPSERAPLRELTRTDFGWAAATGAAAAALFATILTGHPALGDAPETVAGVSSFGVLHAPGYPAYVIAAKLFTVLVPFGSEAFRVNLFSLVCASLSIAGVQLLARRCGAARWASSVAALTLGAGAGFWFYASLAKHDMFSGLLFLIALHLVLAWRARPTRGRLVWLGAVVAAGLGSSWPLMLLLLPTIAFVLFDGRKQLAVRPLLAATATGLVVVVGLYGFVMVRAAQNPAVNWGGATTISRVFELVRRSDFTSGPAKPRAAPSAKPAAAAPLSTQTGSSPPGAGAVEISAVGVSATIRNETAIFARELGLLGLVLAGLGLMLSLTRRRGVGFYALLITFVVNLIGVSAFVAPGTSSGFDVDLIEEGFLLGCYFALTSWLAIGLTELGGVISRARLGRLDLGAHRRLVGSVAAVGIAAALIVPSVINHWSVVHTSEQPYADRYASTVLGELPPHAAVFIWGAELTQPLIYRQVVYHQRPDVAVIAADGLSFDWYRQQVSRRLGRALPPPVGNSMLDARRAVKSLDGVRPVYMDAETAQLLSGGTGPGASVPGDLIGYQPVGLLSKLAPGTGPAPVSSPTLLDQTVSRAQRVAGIPAPNWLVWPNNYVSSDVYSTAELEVARAYFDHHQLAQMRQALNNELSIYPTDQIARDDLAKLNQTQGNG